MKQAISERPEVDDFRHTLYDHLGIERHDYEVRDFIHEMAHNLYNQAYMKASGRNEASASEVRVNTIVSLLEIEVEKVERKIKENKESENEDRMQINVDSELVDCLNYVLEHFKEKAG